MIKKIEIENFRSFRKTEIELKGLNVLIGPNGCGKSNFLDIFDIVHRASQKNLSKAIVDRGGFDIIKFNDLFPYVDSLSLKLFISNLIYSFSLKEKTGSSVPIVDFEKLTLIEEATDASDKSSEFDLLSRNTSEAEFFDKFNNINTYITSSNQYFKENELIISAVYNSESNSEISNLKFWISNWRLYKSIPVNHDAVVRRPQLLVPGDWLSSNGDNLFSVFHYIRNDHIDIWEEIIEILQTFYPSFDNITIPSGGAAGNIMLCLKEKINDDSNNFYANQLSDGTIRLLSLLAILMHPYPPSLICIDEPETSMHPDWLHLLAELMQKASEKTQLIVATHSPELISRLKPEEVIVIEKEKGETTMKRLEEKELSKWLKDYTLGELWTSGHIGGRP